MLFTRGNINTRMTRIDLIIYIHYIHKGYQRSHFDYLGHSSVNKYLTKLITGNRTNPSLNFGSNISIKNKQLYSFAYAYLTDHFARKVKKL